MACKEKPAVAFHDNPGHHVPMEGMMVDMKMRPFGSQGTMVSEVGLGTWQIGGSWGHVPEETAFGILETAVNEGITFFDTADVYGAGRSERLIGSFLKRHPHKIYVATKLGRNSEPGWPGNFTREAMYRHAEASRSRLGVQRLDLIQLHCIPREVLEEGTVFDTLRDMRRDGLVGDFGASVESVEEALICLRQEGIASLQVIFNIFRQKPARLLFDQAKAQGVSIIARVPLASGLLSGKMRKETTFAKEDHRNFNRDGAAFNVGETFAGLSFEKGVELAGELGSLVPGGMSLTEMSLRWILDHEAVSVVIPGASSSTQARANARISTLAPLPAPLHESLRAFHDERVAPYIRGPY